MRTAHPPGSSCARRAGSSTATCSCTSWRCRWRAGWPTCGARGGRSSRASRSSRSGRALAGMAQDLDQLIAARLVQAAGGGDPRPGRDRGGGPPVRRRGSAPGARGHRRADVPRHGRRPVPRGRDPRRRSTRRRRCAAAGRANSVAGRRSLVPAWRWIFYVNVPIGLVAPGPRLGRRAGLGDAAPRRAASTSSVPPCSGSRWPPACSALTLLGATQVAGTDLDPAAVSAGLGTLAVVATVAADRRAASGPATRSSTSGCSAAVPFSAATLVSLLTGYAFATAIIGGAVFVDRVLYGGPGRAAPRARRAGRRHGASAPSCRASRSGSRATAS